MSDTVDTAAYRARAAAGWPTSHDVTDLCEALDQARAELHMANLSCKGYRKERDEAEAAQDRAEAALARVEALIDDPRNFTSPGTAIHLIRNAIAGGAS